MPRDLRQEMESRMGADFRQVRIHRDAASDQAARALDARAFTLGHHVAFARDEFAPGSNAGRHLLAHELAHVVQQSGPSPSVGPMIQRQPSAQHEPEEPSLPPFQLPGTGLTVFPGLFRLTNLGGLQLPLPASLRLTNALSVGAGPTWILDLSPDALVGTILGNVDLSVSSVPGTPPDHDPSPANTARISLVRPIIRLDPRTGKLHGWATLQVPTGYPLTISTPTEISVEIESSELGQFSGRLGYGPLHADFQLRFHYDTGRFESALRPALAPQGGMVGLWSRFQQVLTDTVPGIQLTSVSDGLQSALRALTSGQIRSAQFVTRTVDLIRSSVPANVSWDSVRTALRQFAEELTHPGFALSGGLGLFGLPLSTFHAEAPTTVPLARPLLGAPTPFPLTYSAGGVILAPPGSITDISVPAFGYARSAFGATSGSALTIAALPTLSPESISAGRPVVNQFPVYAYAEFSYVRRVSESVDLGVRLTAQVSTPQLFGTPEQPSADPAERFGQLRDQYLEATQQTSTPAPMLPNFGLTLYGNF